MLLPGLTIVVSPLIALMKVCLCFFLDYILKSLAPHIVSSQDQVDALRIRGVPAASLDSTLSATEAMAVKDDVRSGKLKLLYVAPERLNNEMFLEVSVLL